MHELEFFALFAHLGDGYLDVFAKQSQFRLTGVLSCVSEARMFGHFDDQLDFGLADGLFVFRKRLLHIRVCGAGVQDETGAGCKPLNSERKKLGGYQRPAPAASKGEGMSDS
ncbi:MAG TPA: hypothetical protein VF283_10840 [Bryobacteraceae bacterium]